MKTAYENMLTSEDFALLQTTLTGYCQGLQSALDAWANDDNVVRMAGERGYGGMDREKLIKIAREAEQGVRVRFERLAMLQAKLIQLQQELAVDRLEKEST